MVEVAPLTSLKLAPPLLLTIHCTLGAGSPLAAAVKVAVPPAMTVSAVGCAVTAGAV